MSDWFCHIRSLHEIWFLRSCTNVLPQTQLPSKGIVDEGRGVDGNVATLMEIFSRWVCETLLSPGPPSCLPSRLLHCFTPCLGWILWRHHNRYLTHGCSEPPSLTHTHTHFPHHRHHRMSFASSYLTMQTSLFSLCVWECACLCTNPSSLFLSLSPSRSCSCSCSGSLSLSRSLSLWKLIKITITGMQSEREKPFLNSKARRGRQKSHIWE